MFLGFLLGILAIISGGKLATAGLVFGIPIFDMMWASVRRILKKQWPWEADKKHLHHQLLALGLSQRRAVLFLYLISLIFGIFALFFSGKTKAITLGALFIFAVLLTFALFLVELLKKSQQRQR